MISVDEATGDIVITLGDPDASAGPGRIVAIEDGIIPWLAHRRRVLERLERRRRHAPAFAGIGHYWIARHPERAAPSVAAFGDGTFLREKLRVSRVQINLSTASGT
jgi:hypothetical protein